MVAQEHERGFEDYAKKCSLHNTNPVELRYPVAHLPRFISTSFRGYQGNEIPGWGGPKKEQELLCGWGYGYGYFPRRKLSHEIWKYNV